MSTNPQDFHRVNERLRNSFIAFIEACGFVLYGPQLEAAKVLERLTLDATAVPKQIGIKAGTGVGKTLILALFLVWRWWRAPGSKHLVTAPGERQIRNVTFTEIRKVIRQASWLQDFVELSGMKLSAKGAPDWMIVGAAASDENALRGYHHPEMVAAVEELTGVANENVDTLLRTLSQRNNCFVSIFNPDKITGRAYEMFFDRASHWPWNMTISKLELAQHAPHLVDPAKIEQIRVEYGEDSFQWLVGVLGEFPTQGMSNVIPLKMWERVTRTDKHLVMATSPFSRTVAVDFARFGGDENCIAARQGHAVTRMEPMVCDPNVAAERARELTHELGWGTDCVVVLDAIGIGQGMVKGFEDEGYYIEEFHPRGMSPVEGFKNHLSAAWWYMRQCFQSGNAYIPDDTTLKGQLITREYSIADEESILVESKTDYVKRMGKSPDRADAVTMAFSSEAEISQLLKKPDPRGRSAEQASKIAVPSRIFQRPESTRLFHPNRGGGGLGRLF